MNLQTLDWFNTFLVICWVNFIEFYRIKIYRSGGSNDVDSKTIPKLFWLGFLVFYVLAISEIFVASGFETDPQ